MRSLAHRVLGPCLLVAATLGVSQPACAQQLTTGFDEPLFQSSNPSVRQFWLSHAAAEHAGIVRLNISWKGVVHAVPASEAQASDPSWSGYDFSVTDGVVRDAAAAGLNMMLTLAGGAPRFAEGPGRPGSALAGSWQPNASAYGAFARAVALRYSGTYTPPGSSVALPRVRFWQAWNEPNLSIYLTPQWTGSPGHYRPASPSVYRPLLDAFYAAVKGVDRENLVIAAGTAPYGDLPGGERMPPAQFVRNLLCLDESGRRALSCPQHASFDIFDHHPYAIEGPFWHALNRDDVAIADMGRLTGPLRQAERLRLLGGARRHQVWATELSWDSNPPDPRGVPAAEQARWLEQSMYELWREGVSTMLWYLIVDAPPIPSYAASYQSGVYLLDGTPKPSASAFGFPFVAARAGRGRMLAWLKAPASGLLYLERQTRKGWRVIYDTRVREGEILLHRFRARSHMTLRASIGQLHSLPFTGR
ncbi:MAG TPA: hypothetical protein VIC05_05875 [Solirubrobacteraceae bacterium]